MANYLGLDIGTTTMTALVLDVERGLGGSKKQGGSLGMHNTDGAKPVIRQSRRCIP
jgi:hypothetical protein